MPAAVYIVGRGVISALGDDLCGNRQSLLQSQAGIKAITRLNTRYSEILPAAEVPYSNEKLAEMADMPVNTTRTALLSMIAAKEAFDSFNLPDKLNYRAGFISANTVGGMDKTEDFMKEFAVDTTKGKLHDVIHHDCGAATELVAEKLGITEVVTTISTACSSAANAMIYAARLIRNGYLDWAIAGGTDALSRFTINGFNSLMILDNELCRPFDDTRKGLNLGEGAGYVVLASEKIVALLAQQPTVKLSGFANANDAYHQTASSPEGRGNFDAMSGALAEAGLQPSDIDYINLHGTGTANNDSSEGIAISRLFGSDLPYLSSTKTYTGHTLAACGGIEAIYSTLAIEEGVVFPNLRFQHQMKELEFEPQTNLLEGKEIRHVLSNSFGFGGNCTSLIFSKVN